jgi:hypothetical protein
MHLILIEAPVTDQDLGAFASEYFTVQYSLSNTCTFTVSEVVLGWECVKEVGMCERRVTLGKRHKDALRATNLIFFFYGSPRKHTTGRPQLTTCYFVL